MIVIKLRTQKKYAEASNHVLIGSVVEINDTYIHLNCRSFHFKHLTLQPDQIIEGAIDDRVIPWYNVECINILDDVFPWDIAELAECKDGICLKKGNQATLVSRFKTSHQ